MGKLTISMAMFNSFLYVYHKSPFFRGKSPFSRGKSPFLGKSPFTGPGQWQNVASHASPASLGIPDHSQGGKDLLKALVEVPHGLMIGSMDVSIVLYYIYNVVPPR